MNPPQWRTHGEAPYLILSIGVFLVALSHTLNQQWTGDFWTHAAVVRELARRPWAPVHPLFGIEAPHPFMSPYTLVVGLAARLSGGSAVNTLAAFGLINLIALLIGLRLFCGELLNRRTAFFVLLFSLVLWGADPWRYSGFIHLNALGFVIAYPSIAALAVTMLCWYALLRLLKTSHKGWALLLLLGAPFVLLTHPITGVVLAAGLVALSAADVIEQPRRVLTIGALVGGVALTAALAWPYYPWLTLIATGNNVYSESNLAMYTGVAQRLWPLALAVPVLVQRWRKHLLDPLAYFVGLLAVLYATGALLANGTLGRVIPALVLGLHMAIADGVVTLERRWNAAGLHLSSRLLYGAVSLVVLIGAANMAGGLLRAVPRGLLPATLQADPRLEPAAPLYAPLAQVIGADTVVLADLNFSRHMPAFTGKVVAFIDPEAFVPDDDERRAAVTRFFADISTTERLRLLDRYDARFVAVDQRAGALPKPLRDSLALVGRILNDDGRFLLIERDRR
jgi:hypothetical protein